MLRRNEKCFCGSGKRFKHCHGSLSANRRHEPIENWDHVPQRVRNAFDKVQVRAVGHFEKFGFARPPLIAGSDGNWIIVRGNELLHWKGRGSFLNFLEADLCRSLGDAFRENTKHPIHSWWKAMRAQAAACRHTGKSLMSTAAVLNFFTLANDLFVIADNAILRERLLKSLRVPEQFHGARYELLIASCLIRAGFSIEFTDEDDTSQKHSDATACHKRTAHHYSVEMKAKGRAGILGKSGEAPSIATMKGDVSRLLRDALVKPAKHDRLVFIDMNLPPDTAPFDERSVWWQNDAVASVRAVEQQMGTVPASTSGFVIFTNSPAHHMPLDEYPYGLERAFTAFNQPDFGRGVSTLREGYPDIADLFRAFETHDIIPDRLD